MNELISDCETIGCITNRRSIKGFSKYKGVKNMLRKTKRKARTHLTTQLLKDLLKLVRTHEIRLSIKHKKGRPDDLLVVETTDGEVFILTPRRDKFNVVKNK